jgi:hypothetical protein
MADVTRILSDIEHGDSPAAEKLLPFVYNELRRLAAQKMAQGPRDRNLRIMRDIVQRRYRPFP